MGNANSFMSLGRILGPIWSGYIFDVHVDLPYVSGSIFFTKSYFISLKFLGDKQAHNTE